MKSRSIWEFLCFLELFMCLLEDFLGLLRSSWELPKVEKYNCFFENKTFCKCWFPVLWNSRWPSWVHLGASKADLGPNLASISSPKAVWKLFKNMRQATRHPSAHKQTLRPCSTPKNLLGGPGPAQEAMALPRSHKASQDAPVLQGRPEVSWESLGRLRAP